MSASPATASSPTVTPSSPAIHNSNNNQNNSNTTGSPALGSSPSIGSSIDWVLGLQVRVVTLGDETFEGQVYAYDPTMNCVVLQCPSKFIASTTTTTSTANNSTHSSAASTPQTKYYSPILGGGGASEDGSANGSLTPGTKVKYDFRIVKIDYLKEATSIRTVGSDVTGIESGTGSPVPGSGSVTASSSSLQQLSSSLPNTTTVTATSLASSVSVSASSSPSLAVTTAATFNSSESAGAISRNIYTKTIPVVSYVHIERAQHREQQAFKEAHAAIARIGVGVSSIGQDIFDALSKTLPCRWAKDSIVVMDEVIIAPPYEPENCKANSSASNSLARVKKVLEHERRRIMNGRR